MKKDCPFCEGKEKFLIANTNIEMICEFCVKGVIPKPKNFPIEPGLIDRITNFFNGNKEHG